MAVNVTQRVPRIVRRLEVELDDSGKYTITGDVYLAAMFHTDSPWLVRLAEQARTAPEKP